MSDFLNFNRQPPNTTAVLILSDGTSFWGSGLGAIDIAVGEVVFNTAMTGYQEIMTDPSYAGQIVTFTFPHIGNVGTNLEDIESSRSATRGVVFCANVTTPSNWRSNCSLEIWMENTGIIGISGIDTRALTRHIRKVNSLYGIIAHSPNGKFDTDALFHQLTEWNEEIGLDLVKDVTCNHSYNWTESRWNLETGYCQQEQSRFNIVAIDYGVKHNILRCLSDVGCKITVVPARSTIEEILVHRPDGIFLSNGPGNPEVTGIYAVPTVKKILKIGLPLFGICLGHQILALALGCKTHKMENGHRGANHPVKDLITGKVEITSQNHGFVVTETSLPKEIIISHRSLFDGSIEGLMIRDHRVFSVQYHPEASPGPQDSYYLFKRFISTMET
ncbi:MAG: glutamine-hydrolyzing carbamoyl-phosphate synthase small subunit [Rhodospirillaceae bacterium]|nr:glutamine-hydrolyzing carbamoyl-phosphate synthase small subunit [Rhodospirillaceae bacterium]